MGETDIVVRTMRALETVEETREVVAHLLGVVYELAFRLNCCPRTVADGAFQAVTSDEKWKQFLEPALRESLERW